MRLAIITSVTALAVAGGIARDWTRDSAAQCFAPDIPAASPRKIAFTEDPTRATVRVQLVERPELADIAIADDSAASVADGCGLRGALAAITINARAVPGEPVVYLTHEADADYRIYVDSTQVSPQQAAALIVIARGGHTQLAARPADPEPTGSLRR